MPYALASAFETVEGENLEKLKLNDYNVTNLFAANIFFLAVWRMY